MTNSSAEEGAVLTARKASNDPVKAAIRYIMDFSSKCILAHREDNIKWGWN
jgi:hypothetical protein